MPNTENTNPPQTAAASGSASRRQDQLSQEARDLIAWAFENVPITGYLPIALPMNAIEVRIGPDEVRRLMMGDGIVRHALSDSEKYYSHRNDDAWALVFADDCDGDPNRGAEIARGYSPNNPILPQEGR